MGSFVPVTKIPPLTKVTHTQLQHSILWGKQYSYWGKLWKLADLIQENKERYRNQINFNFVEQGTPSMPMYPQVSHETQNDISVVLKLQHCIPSVFSNQLGEILWPCLIFHILLEILFPGRPVKFTSSLVSKASLRSPHSLIHLFMKAIGFFPFIAIIRHLYSVLFHLNISV